MLDLIFGSPLRTKLLELLLTNPERKFSFDDIRVLAGKRKAGTKRELKHLIELGVVNEVQSEHTRSTARRTKKAPAHFVVNKNFRLYAELRAIVLKNLLLYEGSFTKLIRKSGTIRYLAFTGAFTDTDDVDTDMFIVGRVRRATIDRIVRRLSREVGRPLRYTLFSPAEYKYRLSVGDRFLYAILENKKIVAIDGLSILRK